MERAEQSSSGISRSTRTTTLCLVHVLWRRHPTLFCGSSNAIGLNLRDHLDIGADRFDTQASAVLYMYFAQLALVDYRFLHFLLPHFSNSSTREKSPSAHPSGPILRETGRNLEE
jgi:hypothetical protein